MKGHTLLGLQQINVTNVLQNYRNRIEKKEKEKQ